ncbi:MAG: type III pantothenate kinase [Longimicrobiales bacterium]
MQLVIDVGNTETLVGVFGEEAEDPSASWRISTGVARTPDEYRLLLDSLLERSGIPSDDLLQAVMGSVVPSTTDVIATTLERLLGRAPLVVDSEMALPIRLDVEEPRTVGADRIVNTLAAKIRFGRDTVVVDLGTATTFDCITADGVFLGGVIAPGIQAGIEWLGRRTAKLPGVELRPPEAVIGRRTEACIRSGVFYSAVDAIDGIVRRIRTEWQRPDALVVATGGYAAVLGSHAATVDRVEPHLTLQGLAFAGRHVGDGGS